MIPSDDPGRPTFLSYLSDALLFRYRCNGRLADLDRAVSTAAEAMRSAPEGHPNFASCAYYLGNALLAKVGADRKLRDRDAGIDLFERGIEATAAWDPTRPPCLGSLCQALRIRFSTTGSRADLDAAIDAGRRAVEEAPDGSLSRAGLAGYLSAALLTRFVRSGSQADLDGAAAAGRTAVGAAKARHPDTAMVLAGMGLVLRARFELTRDPQYLDESINHDPACPGDDVWRSSPRGALPDQPVGLLTARAIRSRTIPVTWTRRLVSPGGRRGRRPTAIRNRVLLPGRARYRVACALRALPRRGRP